jgi:Na+-driven multidrug efflux pump
MMSLGSTDPATVAAGSSYISWIAWSFIPASLVIPFESGLRTVERAKIPMMYGALEVGLNIALNYCLILGNFGFPEMGVEGAAIGSLIARTVRGISLVTHVYLREPEVALHLADFQHALSGRRFARFMRVAGPMLVNGLLWSAGFSTAYFIYGRLGVSEVALMTVTWGVLRFAVSLFAALGIASGIAVGHELGAHRPERAWITAWMGVAVGGAGALLIGLGLLIFRVPLLGQFPALSGHAWEMSQAVFWLVPFDLAFRAINVTLIMGALRAGGDVTFILVLDAVCAWGIGLPLAYLAAFHFHWGLPVVYAFALLEEASKTVLVLRRVFAKGWLKNLVDDPASERSIGPRPKPIAAE